MVTSLLRPKEVKESKEEEKHIWYDQGEARSDHDQDKIALV